MMLSGLPVLTFPDEAAMVYWLARESAPVGVWIRFAKKGATWKSLTRREALDIALCHGWIDGKAAKLDDDSYLMRFTPRRSRSLWSQINCARIEQLTTEGKMRDEGLRQVMAAKSDGRWAAAYPPPIRIEAPAELVDALAADPSARVAFGALSKSRRYQLLLNISIRKKPETRSRKIREFVASLGHADSAPS